MHIDFAKEVYESNKNQKYCAPVSDQHILEILAIDQMLDLCVKIGDEKIQTIAKSMKEAENNRYKKVTEKQKYAIAKFLLDNFHDAKEAIAAAFNKTASEMFSSQSN